jgi:predicted thioesterase
MSKSVPVGARSEIEMTVELQDTLTGVHPGLPPVLSTPRMVRHMEEACFHALQPYAEGDEITVGTHINVSHRAATGIGVKVKAEAVMESFDGRFYTMRVRAWDEAQEIGSGTVNRAFVSVAKLMSRVKTKGTGQKSPQMHAD